MSLFFLFCLLEIFPQGLTRMIETQHTVMAALGDEAHFTCKLLQSRDVLQVTWQKVVDKGQVNLATYSKFFGTKVNAGFEDKVELKDPGLQTCSLIVRNVTEQDEGCYRCLFNTYPEGAIAGKSCLKVYELYEPRLDIRESNRSVSCSVTGRPAVTVTLNVPGCDLSPHYTTTSVINTNSTVTVTTAALLSGFCSNRTQVRCGVRVLSGPEKEVFATINVTNKTSIAALVLLNVHLDKESGVDGGGFSVILSVFVVFCVAVVLSLAALLAFYVRKDQKNRNPEENKMPQTKDDTYVTQTPLVKQENESWHSTPRKRREKRVIDKSLF